MDFKNYLGFSIEKTKNNQKMAMLSELKLSEAYFLGSAWRAYQERKEISGIKHQPLV